MGRPATLLLIIPVLILSGALIRSYLLVRSKEDDLDLLHWQVDQLQGKVDEKESTLSYYQSPEFIYKEALEQLGWTNPDEVIPDLPDWKDKEIEIQENPATSSAAVAAAKPLPYWKQWRTLFFEN